MYTYSASGYESNNQVGVEIGGFRRVWGVGGSGGVEDVGWKWWGRGYSVRVRSVVVQ